MQWLVGAQVLDVEAGRMARRAVGIDAGRIVAVGDAPEPEGRVVDLHGFWLLPGLIDCHVHLTLRTDAADPAAGPAPPTDAAVAIYAAGAAARTLHAGVTTVRDVGGWNYVEMAVRSAIERGDIAGPRLFLAGRLLSITTATVAYYPGMYEVADGVDAVRAAARRQLAQGADLIKVMATGAMLSSETEDARAIQYTLEELRAAVEIAHANYKPVAAHAHALAGIENCIDAGVDSIEHCTFADDAALARMAAAGIFAVPTVCAGALLLREPDLLAAMPPHLRERMLEFNDLHVATIARAHRAGVPIAMGTDAGTPGNHHGLNPHECVLLVDQCGLSPIESIRAATVNAARLLRREGQLGVVVPGAHADLIACRADPLTAIDELTRVAWVMKGGTVVRDDR
jgi:imidazolonepropionase-like amidohydrolase